MCVCRLLKLYRITISFYVAHFKFGDVLEGDGLWESLEVDGGTVFGWSLLQTRKWKAATRSRVGSP